MIIAAGGHGLLLDAGRVAARGGLDELRRAHPRAEVRDFGAGRILPGLCDAHIHVVEWALARSEIDLGAATSIDAAVRIVAHHKGAARGRWVVGRGWNPHHWGGAYPTRAMLDHALPDRPAALQSHDMHALWVNTRALEACGIDAHTPDPEGGRIERDADGLPTGTLLETAAQLVVSRIPRPTDQDAIGAVLAAQAELNRYGITAIHSFPGVHLVEPEPLPILRQLQASADLRLRVLQHIALDQLEHAIRDGVRSGIGDDWIRIGGVKMFLDGALGSRTAWMREPYEASADCGVQVLTESDFRDTVQRAAAAGIASTVHAIGDAAVGLAFDVLTAEQAQAGSLPNRIEHVQCCPEDRLAWASRAGIVCSMQPCHLISDWRAAERHWGLERSRRTYAFRSLLDHGATLAFGSDAPVEPCDPRLGFFAAAMRQDLQHLPERGWFPQERLTMAEVLRAYTTGPATVARWPGLGSLEPGAPADFAIWDRDPLTTAGADLLSLAVRATFVGGQQVYSQ